MECPDDRHKMFNSSCYLFVSYPKVTWETARQICAGMKVSFLSFFLFFFKVKNFLFYSFNGYSINLEFLINTDGDILSGELLTWSKFFFSYSFFPGKFLLNGFFFFFLMFQSGFFQNENIVGNVGKNLCDLIFFPVIEVEIQGFACTRSVVY